MKIRTDFYSVNLATGERTRSVVRDGERRDEQPHTLQSPWLQRHYDRDVK